MKKVKGLRIGVIALVFVLASLLIFGGQQLRYRYDVFEPMQTAFTHIDGVKTVKFDKNSGHVDIVVTLGKVDNLEKTVSEIEGLGKYYLKDNLGNISIVDSRDAYLDEVYYRMHFSIEEGIATGHFRQMADDLQGVAKASRLERFRVYVGSDRVYVVMARGGRYLYEVVPRQAGPALPQAGQPSGGTADTPVIRSGAGGFSGINSDRNRNGGATGWFGRS